LYLWIKNFFKKWYGTCKGPWVVLLILKPLAPGEVGRQPFE